MTAFDFTPCSAPPSASTVWHMRSIGQSGRCRRLSTVQHRADGRRQVPDHHGGGRASAPMRSRSRPGEPAQRQRPHRADVADRRFLHQGLPSAISIAPTSWQTMSGVSGADLKDGLLHIDLVREVLNR